MTAVAAGRRRARRHWQRAAAPAGACPGDRRRPRVAAVAARCPSGHELAWPLGGRLCPRCRREKVVAAVAAADPSLPAAVIEAAVDAAAPGGQALRQLADALAADPAALTAGAPPVAGRLALELIARGSAALAIPACTVCGRTGTPLFRGDGGGVCQRCRSWQLARPCATCGKARPAAGFDEHGRAVCEVCRRRDDPRRHRECGSVREDRAGRSARPGRPAGHLRQLLPAARGHLQQMPASGARAPTRQPASRSARRARRGPPPPARAAGTTGRRKPAGRRDRCATRVTARPCSTGGRAHAAGSSAGWSPRPAPALTPAPNAPGSRSSAPAPSCGTEDKLYEKGRCARCSLRRRARELLSAGPPASSPRSLTGVFDAVTAARQPRAR